LRARAGGAAAQTRSSATARPSRAILIVDADAQSRAALGRALERAGYRTEQACTGEHALHSASRQRPAAIILETHLPGVSGYAICRELRDRYGEHLPIIFISAARTEEPDQVAGLLLGADDYLPKPVQIDRLIARVRRLTTRAAAVASSVAARLTPRELEVLTLLTEGLEQDEIARRLFIAPKTVAKHIERVLSKLGVRSRAQAIAIALRDGSLGSAPAEESME
jgi:DNA-binding NarL/FixJ family response regulator